MLSVLIVASLVLTVNWFSNQMPKFFVGVEYAYGESVEEMKALVDKVKDYTNLFVMGSVNLTFNKPALDEACDYIFNSKLYFIVLFTGSDMYNESTSIGFIPGKYEIFDWMVDAKQKYGDKFLGIYRYQEPGGNQIDNAAAQLIESGTDYAHVSQNYTLNLGGIVRHYLRSSPRVFTADYALYWFDYKSSYSSVFVEFGWNHSRSLHIALGRGAASAFNKDWGAIVTWTYDDPPSLQSGDDLYNDLKLAWETGAKYGVVFSYPKTGLYGILEEEHFAALKKFWNYMQTNSNTQGSQKASVAYVLPRDFGFGFRSNNDTIWGLFSAEKDDVVPKIWNDVNKLTAAYSYNLDVIYDEPEVIENLLKNYNQVFYWNQTIT